MNLIFICCFTITLLFTLPLAHCKPKKGNYRGKYPNTLKPRRGKQRKEGKVFKPVEPPNTKSKDQTTSTPTAETPGCVSSRRAKSKSKEPSLEPTQNTDKSHPPMSVMKTQEPTITKRVASKEPSTAKEKSNMKTARRFIPPRKEEYWEDQNEDETLLCVKSIE